MVDPNRKINRLTDKDVEFLEECEREFALRFTEEDAEFMEYCLKPLCDPPIIENWTTSDFSWNDGGGRQYNRSGNRNQRSWRNNYRNRGGGRDSLDDRNKGTSNGRPAFEQKRNRSYPYDNSKMQYKHFVAASKDD